MKRCCPLSTTDPLSGSRKEKARPPKWGFFSSTATLSPFSARALAQESPAKPPPRISASKPMAVEPGSRGEAGLAQARDPLLGPEEHAKAFPADLLEQALVDVCHHLGGQERWPVAEVDDVPGALVGGAGALVEPV